MLYRQVAAFATAVLGAATFAFRETIAAVIAKIADAALKPEAVQAIGRRMTFTVIDGFIVLLLLAAIALFAWPWLSRILQREIETNSVETRNTGRKVFCDIAFKHARDLRIVAQARKSILVDCTIKINRLGLADNQWLDTYKFEADKVYRCSDPQLAAVSAHIPVLRRVLFINSVIYADELYVSADTFTQLNMHSPHEPEAWILAPPPTIIEQAKAKIGTLAGVLRSERTT